MYRLPMSRLACDRGVWIDLDALAVPSIIWHLASSVSIPQPGAALSV
jgi:hypothetical protein